MDSRRDVRQSFFLSCSLRPTAGQTRAQTAKPSSDGYSEILNFMTYLSFALPTRDYRE